MNLLTPFYICTLLLSFTYSTEIAQGSPAPALIKAELAENETLWVGERQLLYVTLYTTTSFSGSTRFELPTVSGLLMMVSEDRPLLGTETVAGQSYMYKRHEILLFPRRSGDIAIPSIAVDFSTMGSDGKPIPQHFSTEAVQLSVEAAPGVDKQLPVVTTTDFSLKESWQPFPEYAKVGDAFTRTITMTGADLPGMFFPPLHPEKVDGLGIYPKQPQVVDRMERGSFSGKRIETVSYVCEREGEFRIPGKHVQWWNPATKTLKQLDLEPVVIRVAANPGQEKNSVSGAAQVDNHFFAKPSRVITLLLTMVAVLALFVTLWRKYGAHSAEAVLEKELFAAFRAASTSGDPGATLQALMRWLDTRTFPKKEEGLRAFLLFAGDKVITEQVKWLEEELYGREHVQKWSGDILVKQVAVIRKHMNRKHAQGVATSLPELNP